MGEIEVIMTFSHANRLNYSKIMINIDIYAPISDKRGVPEHLSYILSGMLSLRTIYSLIN